MSKKVLSMFLVLVMIFTMIPTTVFAVENTVINLDMDHELIAGQEYEIDYVITPSSTDVNKNVASVFAFSNANDIETFYIWDVIGQDWEDITERQDDLFIYKHTISNLNQFGDFESKIRIKFKENADVGDVSIDVFLETVEGEEIVEDATLANLQVHFHLEEAPKSVLTTDIHGAQITANEWYEFNFTLNAIPGDVGKKVVAISNFSDADQIEALEYWEVQTNTWENLLLDTDGAFGDADGFEIPIANTDLTSKFRVKFKEDANVGIYEFSTQVKLMDGNNVTDIVLCEVNTSFDVLAPVPEDPSFLTTTINGASIYASEWYEFDFILHAKSSDAGKKVVGVSEFDNASQIEALEYWEVADNSWHALPLDGNGVFGDADGFEMPAVDYDATSKFRVKFKETAMVGEYSFTVQMKLMDGNTITDTSLCSTVATFNVLAPAPVESSKIEITMDEIITNGEWSEFVVTFFGKAVDAGIEVIDVNKFTNSNMIETLQIWDDITSAWVDVIMTGDGSFGSISGWTLVDVNSEKVFKYRVKFLEDATAGEYVLDSTIKILDSTLGDGEDILCVDNVGFMLKFPDEERVYESTLTNNLDGDEIIVGEWHEFSFTLNAKAADAGVNVVGVSNFANADDIEAIEYWEGDAATGEWKNLMMDGDGNFGAASGFPLPNMDIEVESKFRVKFKETATLGEQSFTAKLMVVATGNVITNEEVCSTTATFELIPVVRTYESTLSNNLDGDEVTVGQWHDFSFTLHAKAVDAGVNVVGVSNFANADEIEAIEYWETATNTWENLMMDGDGNFGADVGFPLPNVDIDVDSRFRVKFKDTATLGEKSFTAKLMVVNGTTVTDEEVCSTTATFELVAAPVTGVSSLTTDINGDEIPLDVWHEFEFILNGSASDAGKKVVGVSQFSDVDIIEALEYWEVQTNTWENLLLDTDGAFGSDEGFNMPGVDFSATSKFRVKFKHPGVIKDNYSFSVQMKVVDGTTVTDEILCETTATFTIDHSPVIDMTEWVHDEAGHWHGATCSCADKVQYATHTASDWIIDKEAKVGEKGEKHKECTICGRVLETAEIPAKSSGGGGGGGSAIRYTNIDVRSDDKEIQYRTNITGTSAIINMSTSELKKIVNDKIDVGMVVIDLSSANKEIEKVSVSNANLEYLLEAAENTDIEGLTIYFENGASIVLKMDAIEHLVEETSRNIEFSVIEQDERDLNTKQREAVEDMTVLGYYEAYISAGNNRISGFKEGSATLHINDEILGKYDFHGLDAYVVDTDGKVSDVRLYYYDDIELVISDIVDYVVVYNPDNLVKSCPKNSTCPLHKFMDVDTYGWYHDGIHYALDNGLMVGYSDSQFGPNDAITRGQIVTILWRLENGPVVNYLMTFKDVKSDAYYAEAVRWAQAEGIVSGYNADSFGPDDAITREQMVTIMQRYAEYKDYDVTTDKSDTLRGFKDYAEISDWAVQSVKWAVDNGIIAGYGNDILGPLGTTTRAQAATIMQRFCNEFCK